MAVNNLRMFDSSDEEDSELMAGLPPNQPLKIDWLTLNTMDCPQSVALSGLPGCRFRSVWQNLSRDLDKIESFGITDIVMLVTKGELRKYRVPTLMSEYERRGLSLHHFPFLDGTAPTVDTVVEIIDLVRQILELKRKVLIHCMGGLGRACVIAACLIQYFDNAISPDESIAIVRDLRGPRAVQTVKQYNFIQEFRRLFEMWMDEDIDRSVSR